MKKWMSISLGAVISFMLLGCGTTTTSRIKEKQSVFDMHPSEVQERIQKGQVQVGDNEDLVYIAWGRPDHKYNRTTKEGPSEVWAYSEYKLSPERQRVSGEFRYRDSKGQWRTAHDDIWVDVDVRHEYDAKRAEFQNGTVISIEEHQ